MLVVAVSCGGDDPSAGTADAGRADGGTADAGGLDAGARDGAMPVDASASGDDSSVVDAGVGPAVCPSFEDGTRAGTAAEPALVEASGLVASRRNPGVLWAHNDSGDAPRLHAMDATGRALGTWAVTGASAQDWEDIAAGPGPTAGTGYLYVGDIGDNPESRASVAIYRVAEPAVDTATPADGSIAAERMSVTYEDAPRNSETLFFDPDTGDLFTVHKTGDASARIYRIGPFVSGGDVTATVEGMVTTPIATGGDVSPDGREIIIRSYFGIRLFLRSPGTTVPDALAAMPCDVPSESEPQGEAIAFTLDGSAYLTVSEGSAQPLWLFARR